MHECHVIPKQCSRQYDTSVVDSLLRLSRCQRPDVDNSGNVEIFEVSDSRSTLKCFSSRDRRARDVPLSFQSERNGASSDDHQRVTMWRSLFFSLFLSLSGGSSNQRRQLDNKTVSSPSSRRIPRSVVCSKAATRAFSLIHARVPLRTSSSAASNAAGRSLLRSWQRQSQLGRSMTLSSSGWATRPRRRRR